MLSIYYNFNEDINKIYNDNNDNKANSTIYPEENKKKTKKDLPQNT